MTEQSDIPGDVLTVPEPRVGPRQVVYKDRYQHLYKVTADFGNFQKEYIVRDSGLRAGIVVVCEDSLLLVRQYRFLINGLSWEIPGGKVDEGETAESAAIRECQEESGLLCQELKPLVTFHPGLDTTYNPTHVFYTDKFVDTPRRHRDAREACEPVWVPLSRCVDMIFGQEISDSLSIISILSYRTLVDKA